MRGLIIEIFSFIAFFVGLFLAIELTIPVASKFFGSSEYFQVVTIVVFVALFVVAVLLINLAAKFIKKVLDLTFLGFFDNLLGAIAGVLKWAFIASVFFWVFDSIGFRLSKDFADSSLIFPYIESLGPRTFEIIGNAVPFIQDMIDSLKNIGEKGKAVNTFL